MDEEMRRIGDRIRQAMPHGMSQRHLAGLVSMAPDALSRALNGQRGLTLVELRTVARVLGADVHWLLTGDRDPHRIEIAARHDWDKVDRRRVNPGREADQQVIDQVADAYRSAFPNGIPASVELPGSPEQVRALLGEEFVRDLAELAEARLGVDVVRVPALSTDYSITLGGRNIILLTTTPNWFRSNWSLAHELGHLALGHHDSGGQAVDNEKPADNFAAELLMPTKAIRALNWTTMAEADLAPFLWVAGVSTQALQNRLANLGITPSAVVATLLGRSTLHVLRDHHRRLLSTGNRSYDLDPITTREQQSTSRRFPVTLLAALQERVESGHAHPGLLAWALNVPIDDIEFPESDEDEAATRYRDEIVNLPNSQQVTAWLRGMVVS